MDPADIKLAEQEVRVNHKAAGNNVVKGHLRYERLRVPSSGTIAAGATETLAKSWGFDIDMASGKLFAVVDGNGDVINDPDDTVLVYCDIGVVGVLTVAASTDDTIINVSPTAVAVLDPGYVVVLGTDEYEVKANPGDGTIELSTALTSNYAASSPITMFVYFVGKPGEPLGAPSLADYTWGVDTIDTTQLPAGKSFTVKYHNSSGTTAKVAYGQICLIY